MDLREFLTTLLGAEPLPVGFTILVRGVPIKDGPTRTEHYGSIDALVADRARLDRWNNEGYSIFWSPTLRDGRNGDKHHCSVLSALWAESDAKEFLPHGGDPVRIAEGKKLIAARMEAFIYKTSLAPSITLDSGGGMQFFWTLDVAHVRRDTKKARPEWYAFMADIETLLGNLQPELRSDPARLDFSSLMRLPTFFNPKYAHKPVSTVIGATGKTYALGSFKAFYPTQPSAPIDLDDKTQPEEPAVIRAFKERDLYIRFDGDKHLVICPWNDEHEGRGRENKTVLFDNGQRITGFKCLGGHCDGKRRLPDVLAFCGLEDEVELVDPEAAEASYLLPLPESARRGLAHDYAATMSAAYGTDYNLWYFAYLTMLAATVARCCRFNSFTQRPLRMYTLFIAVKNEGKSQSRDLTREFFDDVYIRYGLGLFARVKTVFNANSDQGLLAAVSSEGESELAVLLAPDEFATVLKKCSIQNSTLGQILIELYERERTDAWTKDNRKQGNGAPDMRIHLSILGGVTPSDYEAYFDALTALGGLQSRMWLVAAEAPPIKRRRPVAPAPGVMDNLRARTRDAINAGLQSAEMPQTIDMTPEAAAVLDRWAALHDAELGTEAGTRMVDYVEKLAAILTLTRGNADNLEKKMINALDMEIATALGTWELDVRSLCSIDPADTKSARYALQARRAMARLLRDNPKGLVRDSDLRDAVCDYRWAPGLYDVVMDKLEAAGEVYRKRIDKCNPKSVNGRAWGIGAAGLRGIRG